MVVARLVRNATHFWSIMALVASLKWRPMTSSAALSQWRFGQQRSAYVCLLDIVTDRSSIQNSSFLSWLNMQCVCVHYFVLPARQLGGFEAAAHHSWDGLVLAWYLPRALEKLFSICTVLDSSWFCPLLLPDPARPAPPLLALLDNNIDSGVLPLFDAVLSRSCVYDGRE